MIDDPKAPLDLLRLKPKERFRALGFMFTVRCSRPRT